jgi:hypothetical protein
LGAGRNGFVSDRDAGANGLLERPAAEPAVELDAEPAVELDPEPAAPA